MTAKSNQVKISLKKEFQSFIIPLNSAEKEILENSLKKEGCRDPLIVWENRGELILVDGHNRFELCTRNSISFAIKELNFKTKEEVKSWMIDNQLGRRNLTPDQISYYRGLKYLRNKQQRGGYKNVQSKGQKVLSTSERIAQEFNVNEKTIKRDAQFALGLDYVGKSNPKLKMQILEGQSKVKKSHLRALANGPKPAIKIKNEADLYNKAVSILRELDESESTKKEQKEELEDHIWPSATNEDTLFTTKQDRINRIKGAILSELNKAISTGQNDPINRARVLLNQLEEQIINKGQVH
ncbi:MAG: hypothetical protein DHS20C17_00890 [Cyclobacteriaceae bacterium]|nr:MAG: hypothetical protein DHS20C17_00890 [Cyclobacteriaceae bacterium]